METSSNHSHSHHSDVRGKALIWMLALSSSYMVAEIIGGLLSGSLALLADAGHMAADVGAMTLGLIAITISRRPTNLKKTYGYYRAEILAAMANAATLLLISVWIFIEAIERFSEPIEIKGGMMAIVASGGLIVNIVGLLVLAKHSRENLNMKGVWLHVLTDALGSVGALLAGFLVWQFGWLHADPIISIGIGCLILASSWSLLKRSVDELLIGVPDGISIEEMKRDINATPGVTGMHDLHVWSIRTSVNAASAHITIDDKCDPVGLLSELTELLADKHNIKHPTLQLEHPTYSSKRMVACGVPSEPQT